MTDSWVAEKSSTWHSSSEINIGINAKTQEKTIE